MGKKFWKEGNKIIKGKNAISAYGVTHDALGREIVQEFQQCSHCQFTWIIQTGSGKKIGFCTYCSGLLCNKCVAIKWKRVSTKCVPFSEGVAYDTKNYVLDENIGIFLRK